MSQRGTPEENARRRNNQERDPRRGHAHKNGKVGSGAYAACHQVANDSSNLVAEDFGGGTTATQSVVSSNGAATDQFISSTQVEAEDFKKKAPELYQQFQTALGNYKRADTRVASEMAAGDINLILNSAPRTLDASTAALRSKVKELFEKTNTRWKAQEAARDLVLPDADKLRQLARESGITDPKALKDYLSKTLYYHHNSDALASQAGGRKIADTLLDKGALG